MASQAKKNKAKNSYIVNGGEKKKESRLKRLYYYTKQDRVLSKSKCNDIDR